MDPDDGTKSETGDAGASNTCEYAGQVYREGSIVCMAGNEYRCMNIHGRSYTWEPTGRPCAGEADPGGGSQDSGGASQDPGSQGWGGGGSTPDDSPSPSQDTGDSGGA